MQHRRTIPASLVAAVPAAVVFDAVLRMHLASIPITLSTGLLLLAAFGSLLRFLLRSDGLQPVREMPRLLWFVAGAFFMVFLAEFFKATVSHPSGSEVVQAGARLLLVLVAAFAYVEDERMLPRAVRWLSGALAVNGAVAFAYSVSIFPAASSRLHPLIGNAIPINASAGFLRDNGLLGILTSSVVPFLLMACLGSIKVFRSRLTAALLAIPVLLGLLLSGSRSSYLAIALSVCVVSVGRLFRNLRPRLAGLQLTFSLTAIVVVALAASGPILQLGESLIGANRFSIRHRLLQYEHAIALVLEHPWVGSGHRAFADSFVYPDYGFELGDGAAMLHNYFLNSAVSLGIPVAALELLVLVVTALAGFLSLPSRERDGYWWALGLLAALLGIVVELSLYVGGSGLKPLWLLIVWSISLARRRCGQCAR